MIIKSVEEIIRDIKTRYDKEPKGWRVLKGKDNRGHQDTYILQGSKHLWQLKTELKTPYRPIGVGARLGWDVDSEIKRVMDIGRDFPFGEVYPQKDDFSIIALGLGKYSTEGTSHLKGILSSKQERLDAKLKASLDKLLYREGMFKEFG